MTAQLVKIGWLLDIKVFDPIVIAGDRFTGMARPHMIDTTAKPSIFKL